MASFTPTPDIPILVTSPSTSSERRITPSWTLSQLKQKLEFVTGIPPSAQRLQWKAPGVHGVWMEGEDKELGRWGLVKGGEIEVGYLLLFPFCRYWMWLLDDLLCS
jgi:tubulin-folding cofactor B